MDYLPAESNTGMFGGNSNWRGPVWMPVNVMIIRALLNFYLYYGDNFKIECPTGSGKMMNLFEVSKEIADRLSRIFLRDERGRRPVYGGTEKFQSDPHWRDHILFYEYFHGDNGAGLGASHQTGWTGDRGENHPALRPPGCQAGIGRGQEGCVQGGRVQQSPLINTECSNDVACHDDTSHDHTSMLERIAAPVIWETRTLPFILTLSATSRSPLSILPSAK